eukprot:g5624.t1
MELAAAAIALETLTNYFVSRAARLCGSASGAFANKGRCTRLGQRLLLLKGPITAIGTKQSPSLSEREFVKLAVKLADDATDFVAQFQRKDGMWGFVCKMVQSKSDAEAFADLNRRINELSLDLSLSINAGEWASEDAADTEVDRKNLEAMVRSMLERQEKMQEQQGQNQTELLAAINSLAVGGVAAPAPPPRQPLLAMYDYEPDEDGAYLGEGAVGEVYCMKSKADGSLRAVKMVSLRKLRTFRVEEEALRQEARAMQRLYHKNIVRYFASYDLGRGSGRKFCLVMELAPGGSVFERLKEARAGAGARAIPEAQIVAWAAQVGSALHHMHAECRMIHRDLKPQNLLLDAQGDIKVADLGLACADETNMAHTSHVGTNSYMSPEKARAQKYGPKDDMWAMGCVLFELLVPTEQAALARFAPAGLFADKDKVEIAVRKSAARSALLGPFVRGLLEFDPELRLSSSQLRHVQRAADEGARYDPGPSERLRREAAERARAEAEAARRHAEQRAAEQARLLSEQARELEETKRRARAASSDRRKASDARRKLEEQLEEHRKVVHNPLLPKVHSLLSSKDRQRIAEMRALKMSSEQIEDILALQTGTLALLDAKAACERRLRDARATVAAVRAAHGAARAVLQEIRAEQEAHAHRLAAERQRQRDERAALDVAAGELAAELRRLRGIVVQRQAAMDEADSAQRAKTAEALAGLDFLDDAGKAI